MKNNRPIFWHQGLFLQPQHFQLSDMYFQSTLASMVKMGQPSFWGASKLEIDKTALVNGSIALSGGEFIFPDGTHVEFPGNTVIRPRSFEEAWTDTQKPFKIFLGLRKWEKISENVTILQNLDNLESAGTRFVATADPEEITDYYHDGPPAQVKRLYFLMEFFWEDEADKLAKYDLIPLAVLENSGNETVLSGSFIHPCLLVNASEKLHDIIMDIMEKMVTSCRTLEKYKNPSGVHLSDADPKYLFFLLGLSSLNRHIPLMTHLVHGEDVHPERIYEVLVQLIGDLSTFSEDFNTTGEGGEALIPPYDHQDLFGCFSALYDIISKLLDELTLGREMTIRLEYVEPYFVGKMGPSVFGEGYSYYLVLKTESEVQEVVADMEKVAKLSALENLHILVSRALPGLKLDYTPIPPPALPRSNDSIYFKIDIDSTQWDDLKRFEKVGFHWDSAPFDLVAEIVVLRRS